MTTTTARDAIRRTAAENGWETVSTRTTCDVFARGASQMTVDYAAGGTVHHGELVGDKDAHPFRRTYANGTGKRAKVLAWLTEAPPAPAAHEPGAHQQALKDAELVNWISTRMTGLRLAVRNHREQLAALARTETVARLSRHLRGAMEAEEQLYVFQDALTAAVHRPLGRTLAEVIMGAMEPYLTFQTPATDQERDRRVARLNAAEEIRRRIERLT